MSHATKDHFDLLPFIAILMCVLACLLLVTMSIAALSIGPAVGEGWVPSNQTDTDSKLPVLIEWDGSTAVFHRDGDKVSVKWSPTTNPIKIGGQRFELPGSNVDSSLKEFAEILGELSRKKETHYALFAIRPSGFETFGRLVYEFRRRGISVGYEPIDQEKQVRLIQTRNRNRP